MRGKGKVVPRYRKHRTSGQAIVTLNGQDHYLGRYGTKASEIEYDRLIAEWLARGRVGLYVEDRHEITVVELVLAYIKHCRQYYQKHGKITNEVTAISNALKVVKNIYGRQSANEFGPLKLQVVQNQMIKLGWCRKQINKQISRVVRAFRWAVSKELIRADVAHGLSAVPGLRKGRSEAKETNPILPIEDSIIQLTLPHVSQIVGDMVKLQRLTAMRPEEVCKIRPMDIERTGDVWLYRPVAHKNEHHDLNRVVPFGPKAKDIIRPYLIRAEADFCFSPIESERKRRHQLHVQRKVPIKYGNTIGTNRKRNPIIKAGDCYTPDSYRRAIHRGCDKAKIARWSPNRLRHTAGTEIRKKYGLEAAQVILGHTKADITQVYAERDLTKAIEVAKQVG